jgi:S1-C subfamily serine protease
MALMISATRTSALTTFILCFAIMEIARGQPVSRPDRPTSTQRVILYEEDPSDPKGKRFEGSAVWSSGQSTLPGDTKSEPTAQVDVKIPERELSMTMAFRRNTDMQLPASHTIEIKFSGASTTGRPHVTNVPGILLKSREAARGIPLAGLAVKVSSDHFLIGLSAVPKDNGRNLKLLRDNVWFDIPIVFENGRRAILAIERHERSLSNLFGTSTTVDRGPQSNNTKPDKQEAIATSSGSGFFVTSSGHLLTNAHVVKACRTISARLPDGRILDTRLIATSESDDLAVLKTEEKIETIARFRVTPSIRAGEAIVVFGFPLSGLLASTGNATIGNVTALAGMRDDSRQMQISAPVQPGNSGGPVIDMSGNLAGIVVSKLNAMKMVQVTQDVPQNINFAIKGSVAINFLESRGIGYSVAAPSQELSILEERAKAISAEIKCSN